jgi:hypothetical protein
MPTLDYLQVTGHTGDDDGAINYDQGMRASQLAQATVMGSRFVVKII